MRQPSRASQVFALLLSLLLCHVNALSKNKLAKNFEATPENVRATFPSEPCGDSVLIQWTAPSQDFLIQSYLVICETPDLVDRVSKIVDDGSNQAVIGPLKSGSTYSCSVAARTKLHGTGQPSFIDPFLADTRCPGSPSNVGAEFPSENCGDSVRITWDAPLQEEVDYYTIVCDGDDVATSDAIAEGNAKEAIVGPLNISGIVYTCSVTAVNEFGNSQPSSIEFVTGECAPPPRNVVAAFSSVFPECANNVNVSWDPSETGIVESYIVKCTSDVDSYNVSVSGQTTSVIFGNVSTPLVEYNCSVQATNSAGFSEETLASPLITQSCPPVFPTLGLQLEISGYDTPEEFTDDDRRQICLNVLETAGLNEEQARCGVIDVLPGSVLVFIQAVTTELYGESLEQAALLLENGNQDALLLLLQGLSVSDAQVSVLSVEVGASLAESNDFTEPSGARNVRATPFATECVMKANVTWDKPANDGGASVSKYFVTCSSDTAISPPGTVVNFDVFSVTIGPFQPGNFTCSVKALNAAGAGVEASSQNFIVINPFQVPAINAGCPVGQYCRNDGCSQEQCITNNECGAKQLCDLVTKECVCDASAGFTDDGEGGCQCDASAGFASDGVGGCECDAAKKFVDDGAGGCECDASAGFVSDGAGGCECDASAGFVSDGAGGCECDASAGFVSDGAGGCECDTERWFVRDGAGGCECDAGAGYESDGKGECKPGLFYLAENRITVLCPEAAVGSEGVVNGLTFTKRSKVDITTSNAADTCTSDITNMDGIFAEEVNFNGDISHWDTSSVTNMAYMFIYAQNFNQAIGSWDTSSVTSMTQMFDGATIFDQNLSSWCVSEIPSKPNRFDTSSAFQDQSQKQPDWGQPC